MDLLFLLILGPACAGFMLLDRIPTPFQIHEILLTWENAFHSSIRGQCLTGFFVPLHLFSGMEWAVIC
jgi:hypothetical protein